MKKLIVMNMLVALFLVFTGNCYASNWIVHEAVWVAASEIPIGYGGFGGKFPVTAMPLLHAEIDGRGGWEHRHNGSHNPNLILQKAAMLIKKYNIPKQVVINAVIIHNLVDMVDPGTDGTNGHKATAERRQQAKKLIEKIHSKVGFKNSPTWARVAGSEVGSKMAKALYKFKKFTAKLFANTYRPSKVAVNEGVNYALSNPVSKAVSKAVKKVLSKVSVVVEMVPPSVMKHAGPIIYVTYEGSTFVYRVAKGTSIQEEIVKAVSITAGVGGAALGMKVGLIICAPLEAVGGPLLHFGGATIVSVVTGIGVDYIAEYGIKYVKVIYL